MIPNKMLCCGGEKESTRDLKSAQNTPSRQMLPYSQQHPSQQSSMSQHQQPLGPPPLSQQQGTRLGPTGMMGRGPNTGGMGQQHGIHHNQNMMNSFDHPGAHKDEFRKVIIETISYNSKTNINLTFFTSCTIFSNENSFFFSLLEFQKRFFVKLKLFRIGTILVLLKPFVWYKNLERWWFELLIQDNSFVWPVKLFPK